MNKFAITLILSSLLFCACSSSKSGSIAKKKKTIEVENTNDAIAYTSLADFLRRNSSVSVTGVDPDIRLQIRGMNSVNGDTRPFIYVDKSPMGRDYVTANNYVNPNNIKRVEVISSLSQLVRYGQEGHSGVIIVHTRSN